MALAVLSIGIWVGLAASLVLEAQVAVGRFLGGEVENLAWTVFLRPEADVALLEKNFRQLPGVKSLSFTSQEKALAQWSRDPAFEQTLLLIGGHPFPETFHVKWKTGFITSSWWMIQRSVVRRWEGVEDVVFDEPRLVRYEATRRWERLSVFAWGVLGGGVLLSLGWALVKIIVLAPFEAGWGGRWFVMTALGLGGGALGAAATAAWVTSWQPLALPITVVAVGGGVLLGESVPRKVF